jgi:signal transduction histidine kinase
LNSNKIIGEGEETDSIGVNSNHNLKEESIFLSVSVADSGIGMSEELKKKCFVLFGNLKFKKDIN